jgi:hypothetical protein
MPRSGRITEPKGRTRREVQAGRELLGAREAKGRSEARSGGEKRRGIRSVAKRTMWPPPATSTSHLHQPPPPATSTSHLHQPPPPATSTSHLHAHGPAPTVARIIPSCLPIAGLTCVGRGQQARQKSRCLTGPSMTVVAMQYNIMHAPPAHLPAYAFPLHSLHSSWHLRAHPTLLSGPPIRRMSDRRPLVNANKTPRPVAVPTRRQTWLMNVLRSKC